MNASNELVETLAGLLLQRGWMLATAESCTGGMIAAACTDRAGSSEWFERGLVSYSNAAKHDLLGVPEALIGGRLFRDHHELIRDEELSSEAEGAFGAASHYELRERRS